MSFSENGQLALTLQENNGIVLIDAAEHRISKVFSAGKATVTGIDTKDDGEGIYARPEGGYWLAVEGANGPENKLVLVDKKGCGPPTAGPRRSSRHDDRR